MQSQLLTKEENMNKTRFGILVASFLLVVSGMGVMNGECAQKGPAYPAKPITLIVPYTPGGPADLGARAYAEALKNILPHPIVVVNEGGGSTVPAVYKAVSSKPDGYTLLYGATNSFTVVPQLQPAEVPFKGPQDAKPIITAAYVPNIFCVGATQPWQTMKDLLAYAKANPEKIRVTATGMGSGPDIHLSHLEQLAGVKFTHINTPGAAQGITSVLGNQVEALVLNTTPVIPHFKAGKMRILATFTGERLKELDPNAPTLKELGYDVLAEGNLYLIFGPKGLPQNVVDTLYVAFKKAQQTESLKKFFENNGLFTDDRNPNALEKQLQEDYKFYSTFLKQLGLIK
jgi:tripartite-type tricarboxylate transporter receptor subunit TctC